MLSVQVLAVIDELDVHMNAGTMIDPSLWGFAYTGGP